MISILLWGTCYRQTLILEAYSPWTALRIIFPEDYSGVFIQTKWKYILKNYHNQGLRESYRKSENLKKAWEEFLSQFLRPWEKF